MGETTQIAWTDSTWNPWQGCHKVSQACKFCYMFRDKKRYGQDPSVVVRSSPATFNKPFTWAKNREKYGHIKFVFTCSWSDFFIEEADPWRMEAWEIIRRTPELTYQILTKRPERIRECLPPDWHDGLPNVWLGITGENDMRLEERWTHLRRIPSVVRFISYEPALGPISVPGEFDKGPAPDWLIVGCESGPEARETDLDWVRCTRDTCTSLGVGFFLKQLVIDGKLTSTPFLDGEQWTEFPEVTK